MRDDFSARVRRLVAQRAGHRCAFPSCGAPTDGPGSSGIESVRVGVAAHITGASKEGPRFDSMLTTAQRKAADNAIWMCGVHGKWIDDDVQKFSPAQLRMLKAAAEARAARELGIPRRAIAFSSIEIREDLCCWDPARKFRDTNTSFGFHIIPSRFWEEVGRSPTTHCADPILDITLTNNAGEAAIVSALGLRVIRTWTSMKGLPEVTPIESVGSVLLPIRNVAEGSEETVRLPKPMHVPPGAVMRVDLQLAGFSAALHALGRNESEVALVAQVAEEQVWAWPMYLGVY